MLTLVCIYIFKFFYNNFTHDMTISSVSSKITPLIWLTEVARTQCLEAAIGKQRKKQVKRGKTLKTFRDRTQPPAFSRNFPIPPTTNKSNSSLHYETTYENRTQNDPSRNYQSSDLPLFRVKDQVPATNRNKWMRTKRKITRGEDSRIPGKVGVVAVSPSSFSWQNDKTCNRWHLKSPLSPLWELDDLFWLVCHQSLIFRLRRLAKSFLK